MIVYILIGDYERSFMSEIFGAFDSKEKAIKYIEDNFEDTKYDESCGIWTVEVYHDTAELRIVTLEVQ